MQLTVEHNIIANLTVQALQLRKSIGAFDLLLNLGVTMTPTQSTPRWARVDSVGIHVQSAGGGGHLATLRPATPARFEQTVNALTYQVELQATLQRRQLLELEDLRNGQDLLLRLTVTGVGGMVADDVGRVPVHNDIPHNVRRSEWVAQLNGAGAMGVLLLEAAIPFAVAIDDEGVARRLQVAEGAFANGEYGRCVGECRLAYDRLGLKATPKSKLLDNPLEMSFAERVDLLIAATRHCTHLPHHDDGDAISEHVYSREEARLALQITASALAFWLKK